MYMHSDLHITSDYIGYLWFFICGLLSFCGIYEHYIEYFFSVDEKINHWYEKTLALQGIHLELFNLSQANEKDYRIRPNPGFFFLSAHLYSL